MDKKNSDPQVWQYQGFLIKTSGQTNFSNLTWLAYYCPERVWTLYMDHIPDLLVIGEDWQNHNGWLVYGFSLGCLQIFRQQFFVEQRFLKNMHTKTQRHHISWNFKNILLIFYSFIFVNLFWSLIVGIFAVFQFQAQQDKYTMDPG